MTDLSLDDLADLVDVRVAIESVALRWAIEHGDMTWESQVVAAHYRLANTPMTTDDEVPLLASEWIRAHSEFHATILSGCASPRMRDITGSLSDAAEIYRRWSLPLAHPRRDLAGEHASLMKATLERDADTAVTRLTEHIEQTRDTLLKNATSDAEPLSPLGP